MRSRRRFVAFALPPVLGVAFGLLAVVMPSFYAAASPVLREEGVESGADVYREDCAWCHGDGGRGTSRGPSLHGVGSASVDFMLSTGRMPIPNVVDNPPRSEPAYDQREIDALTSYITQTFGEGIPIPLVDPADGDLATGLELYEANCAACHSSTGIGDALTNGLEAPSVLEATPRQVAEAVRIGGAGVHSGNMPKFGPEIFDQRQLDSISAYVLHLQEGGDHGGAGLGRYGPIAEGLVAWLVGLLLLVAFVRWIGERA